MNNLIPFLNNNKIILDNHHGGRSKHSTVTALSNITHILNTHYDNDRVTATLTTDLTAAFDTVDTTILLDKLKHYGIDNNEHKLLKNYMTDRKQYVQIDTFNSYMTTTPKCGVIQGSKMSRHLYTLYVNEVTILHNLLNAIIQKT